MNVTSLKARQATGPATGNRIAIIVEYDGTGYHGSQWQANAPTIQGEIEKALEKLTGEKLRIKAASRTDAGVHARGQVVCFGTGSALPLQAFVDGLNHYLPRDIAVKEAFRVDDNFDARRGARSREYRYYMLNKDPVLNIQSFASRNICVSSIWYPVR